MAGRTVRLVTVCLVGGTLIALLVGYLAWVSATGRGIVCLICKWTGFSCGSCGMTRALMALGRLDMASAFGYNLLWPLYAAWAVWVAMTNGRAYVRHGRWVGLPGPLWVHGAFVVLVTLYGVLRNMV